MTRAGGAPTGLTGLTTVLTVLSIAASTRADVADDARVLMSGLRAEGAARTTLLPPRLLASRETLPIALPASVTSGAAAGCTTVTVLGAVSTVFALRLPGGDLESSVGDVFVSVGGAQMIARCGAARQKLSDLSLEMRSPRGVIETVVAESSDPLPPLHSFLPHRDPGFIPGPGRPPGAAPHAGPLRERASSFEESWVHEAVEVLPRRLVPGDESGAGRLILDLSPGCHRIAVLAVDSDDSHDSDEPEGHVHDIDAELAWISGDVAAVDRTDGPDATLTACAGSQEPAIVAFAGAAPHGAVLVLHGRSDLPRGIPEDWGPAARARISRALIARRAPAPASPPIYSSLGVAGLTLLPVEVEPGQCYLAALALIDGSAKLVALSAATGTVRSAAHTDEPNGAAILTFCAGSSGRATLETEVHGASLVSALGVWPLGHRRLGEDTP